MKLGFISINVPGHLNPMTTLARHLQRRGHEVVFSIHQVQPIYRLFLVPSLIKLARIYGR
jgi:zeaxanthin glucosyltransferase